MTIQNTAPAASSNKLDQMAAALLGEDTTDEVQEPEEQAAEPEQDEDQKPTQEPSGSSAEPETDEEEGDSEGEPEDSTDGEGSEEDESEPTEAIDLDEYQQVLADSLGLEPEQLKVNEGGEVTVTTKVDGVTETHTLPDLVKGFQTNKHNTQKSQALAEERREFEKLVQEKAQQIEQTLEQNTALAGMLEQELLSEYEGIDWNQLKMTDPGEYAALKTDMTERYQRIQGMKGQLEQQREALMAEQQQKMDEQQQEYLKAQYEKMLANNPAWQDQEVLKRDMNGLKEFASNAYGFSDEDFKRVTDARLIELLKDAKAYRDGSKFAEKKVVQKPKFKKATKQRPKAPKLTKLDKLTKMAKSAKGANKRKAQTDAIAELLLKGG